MILTAVDCRRTALLPRAGATLARAWALALSSALTLGAASAATLTLGVVELPHAATLLIAAHEGYYAAEGLEVKILPCVSGKRCMELLRDGSAQVITSAGPPIVLAAHAGMAFDIVATFERSDAEGRIVARADRGIRTAADLKGRRLGYLVGSGAHYYADTFLLVGGVDPASVQRVALDPADPTGPLIRGEIDAAAYYQPHAAIALDALGAGAAVLPMARVYTSALHLVSLPAARGVDDATLRALLRAVQRGERLWAADPARWQAWLARRLKLDPRLLRSSVADMKFGLELGQMLVTTLEAQSRWAQREGLVPAGPMPDYLARIRPAPLHSVAPRAVSLVR